jgi:Fe-Mn family superoxide dismutase
MTYKLSPLPYAYDALEPYIDARTMEIHYTKHHQGYVNNLNVAVQEYKEFQNRDLRELLKDLNALPDPIRTAIRNYGGGDFNHTMFWSLMKKNGGGQPNGKLGQAIHKVFQNFDHFQDEFNAVAKSVFGSGWAWLCLDANGKLLIISSYNQDNPISKGYHPILGLDVWEHAYYLKYENRRPDYINAWWHVINWDQAEENYRALIEK